MADPRPETTRAAEQEALGASFAANGFPRHPPHDEPADCRKAWLRGYNRPHHRLDLALLEKLTEREARIADAATRLAYDKAGDWLSSKQTKSERFPGGNLEHARGRAAAYQNAAQEIYRWAIAAEAYRDGVENG